MPFTIAYFAISALFSLITNTGRGLEYPQSMAASVSAFTLFPKLPPELRNRIWCDVLPDADRPALFRYRTGCWHPRYLTSSDEGYLPDASDNVDLEFKSDLLNHVPVRIPLGFVNREARSIGLAWAREQGFERRFCEDRRRYIFVRPFDITRDTIFIRYNRLGDFCAEPSNRLFEPDLLDRMVSSYPEFRCIAVHELLLQREHACQMLPGIFEWHSNIEVLYIILGAESTILEEEGEDEDSSKVQRQRWELDKSIQGTAFVWNSEDGIFDRGDEGNDLRDTAFYERLESYKRELGEELLGSSITKFEIRPIRAIRK